MDNMKVFTCRDRYDDMATCIYEAWSMALQVGHDHVMLMKEPVEQLDMFADYIHVEPDADKVQKFTRSVKKVSWLVYRNVFNALLSHQEDALDTVYRYLILAFAEGRKVEDAGDIFALLNDLPGAFAAGKFPIFEARDGRVVIPVTGMGLWGPVWGYLALEKDMNTVAGIIMAHKGETPGLGAEISTPKYQALFVGKQIFDGDKFVSVKLRKGGAKDPLHEVDAISGGTKTSDGVSLMLENSLRNYLPLLEAKRTASEPAAPAAEVSNEENVGNNE